MTISNEPERHEQLKRLLDETLAQVEQAARRQGMNVEPQTEIPRAEVDYAAGDRTLFPADASTEHMLPDLADDDMSRVVVRIGAFPLAGEWQRVLDKRSGLWVEVRRAHCGAECDCGGEVRLVEQPGEEREALDDDAPEGTPAHWQPCTNADVCGRRTMHVSGLCSKCRKLDAAMRDQMAQWPDDTLALITVGELRQALRRAFDVGDSRLSSADRIVEQLVRDLPVSDEERAAHGLPNVGRRESFERPGSAYDGVRGCSCGMADYDAPGHDGGHAASGEKLTEDDWRGVVAGDPWLSTQTAEHGAVTPSGRFEVVGPDSVGNVDVYDQRQDESPGPWLILPGEDRRELVDALAVTLPVDPDVMAIVEQLRYAVDNGVGVSLDAGHAAALTRHLGRQR